MKHRFFPEFAQARRKCARCVEHEQVSARAWRLSKTPVLAQALPLRYFDQLGIPSLAARKEFNLSNRRGT
ncbi:hypothetical protein [Nitrosomonas sp.]|uniref:hypothetical protein n=1 Tax=Nitrosomonas sp. TaxID=42353 RepID=UPI0025E0528C|nr:hypothetical protein [Nitrosomonas sp.]